MQSAVSVQPGFAGCRRCERVTEAQIAHERGHLRPTREKSVGGRRDNQVPDSGVRDFASETVTGLEYVDIVFGAGQIEAGRQTGDTATDDRNASLIAHGRRYA
jgi:hypothetical protein